MAETADVVVVGAGVVGCSVAYYLSRQGADVKLVEREGIGSGASTHATGFLSLLGAEFSQGPSFEFALSAYREFPDLVKDLEESTGIDLLYQRRPSLRLALEEEEETLIRDLMKWQQESVSVKWIGPDEVHAIEPRLTPQIRGAAYENESAQLDSYRMTLAMAQSAEKRGMELQLRPVTGLLRDNSRVTGVSTATGDIVCGTVVMAAGTWSSSFGESINFQIPVRPLKGERLIFRFDGPPLPVLISSPKRGHMISRLDGVLSVGSTGGRDYDQNNLFLGEEYDSIPTETAKLELLQRAIDVLPELESAELIQQLAGSRPLSPDRMPIIGPVPGMDGIVLATGHSTKGIHLGPITGRIIAEYIQSGCTRIPQEMEAFLPSRFKTASAIDFHASGQLVDE